MTLAIFDLDNTLLKGDSDYLWGQFLVDRGLVDRDAHEAANRRFYEEYAAGTLDIERYLRFALAPLTRFDAAQLHDWRREFVQDYISPIILPAGRERLDEHAARGDTTMIITATNAFITDPIAELFGVDHLLATRPERIDGRYTGDWVGTPTFREGKVRALDEWLRDQGRGLDQSWFYSDSHNDLPLLERVPNPVAVDPDERLRRVAGERNWPILSFRDE
ncbi:HAD family hydrolase [Natronocella acetinitrilica]|uniref:histidinol-phosphatase n=1 Tax=Natronocella acetinitrilica TaxID=414046 RepID=UPI0034507319